MVDWKNWLKRIISGAAPRQGQRQANRKRTPKSTFRPQREELEDRTLPSTVTTSLTPAMVAQAYGVSNIMYGSTVGNGQGQTIAIIDPGDDSAIASDLATFDSQYNLPAPPSFSVVSETGGPRPTYIGISTATVSGTTVTITTTSPNGLAAPTNGGNPVTIAEAGNAGFDGSFPVFNVTSTTFQYTDTAPNLPSSAMGGTVNNPVDTGETALDVEWAHAMAPGANIVLVEMTHGFATVSGV
jgi:subtilase family serine protease